MPKKFQHALQNFAAGVVSPRFSARVDLEAFPHCLREGKNFIISSQGGAAFREGGQFLGFSSSNAPFRLFQFHRGGEISDLLLEVSEGVIRFWLDTSGQPELYTDLTTLLVDEDDGFFLVDEDDGAFLTVGVVTEPNPYSLSDLDDLYFTNQDKYGIICSKRHPPLYITLRRNGQILSEHLPLERIPQFAYNDTSSITNQIDGAIWRVNFPTSWLNNAFFYRVTYKGIPSSTNYSYIPDNPTQVALDIDAGLTEAAALQGFSTEFEVTHVALIDGSIAFDIVSSGDNAGWPITVAPFYGPVWYPVGFPPFLQTASSSAPDEEPAWSYPTMVLHNGRYYQCIRVHTATTADEPGVGELWEAYWIDLGIGVPDGWDYQYPVGNDWVLAAKYAISDRGFPQVCVFHEQRLILMSNPDNPTAIYGSGIGAFQNFIPGPNDDEPWLFVLDSSDTPQIKWARSHFNLTLGTSSGDWSLSSEITLTPTDINAEHQNNARSQLGQPVQIDTDIFYIEQGGRKVRATSYVREKGSFTSSDVSLMAEHLISEEGVKRIVVSHAPEVMITLLRRNGQPVFFANEKVSKIIAYSEGKTDGVVYDMASYFSLSSNRDDTYWCVLRNGNYMLERMRYPTSKQLDGLTANGVVHLDGWVTGTVVNNRIDGLQHLEGKAVSVLLDDAWQVESYIVEAGSIVLRTDHDEFNVDHDGKIYAVGLPYEGVLETFEIGENFQGTGLGTLRRWLHLTTRFLNSAYPKVYGQRERDRHPPIPMDEADVIQPGLTNVDQAVMGYSDGAIRIVQDRPYPTYVVGFYGEYQVEDR